MPPRAPTPSSRPSIPRSARPASRATTTNAAAYLAFSRNRGGRRARGRTDPTRYVIACFGDPGLDQARTLVDVPVLGIAQAAMHAAALTAGGFSVVTSMSATVPRAWELAKSYTPQPVPRRLRLRHPRARDRLRPSTIGPIGDLCERALAEDRSRAIVLGCAAMAKFAGPLTQRLGVPVIDGVVAATVLAEALVETRPGQRTTNSAARCPIMTMVACGPRLVIARHDRPVDHPQSIDTADSAPLVQR